MIVNIATKCSVTTRMRKHSNCLTRGPACSGRTWTFNCFVGRTWTFNCFVGQTWLFNCFAGRTWLFNCFAGRTWTYFCGPGLITQFAGRARVCTTAAGGCRAWDSNHICGPGLGLNFRPTQGPSGHDQWQCAAVTPQVNLNFSFVSRVSKHLIEFISISMVVPAIAVFRLVDNILSSSLHC